MNDSKNHFKVRELGRGTFGIVEEWMNNGRPIAKKFILNQKDGFAYHSLREIIFMKHVNGHPNLITCSDVYSGEHEDSEEKCLIYEMELFDLDMDKLQDSLSKNKRLKLFPKLLFQLSGALLCLHNLGIMHRDIKMNNVLVRKVYGEYQFVLADFGLSRAICNSEGSIEYDWDTELSVFMHYSTQIYTSPCKPPEIDRKYVNEYDFSSDVCALGLTILFFLTKKWSDFPKTDVEISQWMTDRKIVNETNLIISSMIKTNPKERPSILDIHQIVISQFNFVPIINALRTIPPHRSDWSQFVKTRPSLTYYHQIISYFCKLSHSTIVVLTTVDIIDRYLSSVLSRQQMTNKSMLLLAFVSYWMSSKLWLLGSESIRDLLILAKKGEFTSNDFIDMEHRIMIELNWWIVLPVEFLSLVSLKTHDLSKLFSRVDQLNHSPISKFAYSQLVNLSNQLSSINLSKSH